MRIPFVQVDAFAERAFAGNPAAVMPLTRWLDDATLLAIHARGTSGAVEWGLVGGWPPG